MSTTTRGQHLERLAQALLESRGWLVERARNVVRWLPDKKTGTTRPLSLHHDFFGRWDGIYVGHGVRGFYQVTTQDNFHARRAKILLGPPVTLSDRIGAGDFPVGSHDLILAHKRGTRIFRVARGPLFLLPDAEAWEAPKSAVKRRAKS